MPAGLLHVRKGWKINTIKRAMIFIRQDAGVPWKVSKAVVRSLEKFIERELVAGREPVLAGLGKWKVRKQRGWSGVRKLKHCEKLITSPDIHLVQFTPAKHLRLAVKNKFGKTEIPVDEPKKV